MSRRRSKSKPYSGGSYIALPHALINSPNWRALSPFAVKLVIDLFAQYKGANNGDLCAAWSLMKVRGWRSKATLWGAIRELEHYGMIVRTRQGGRRKATLYAVTWRAIDSCGGKLDVRSGPQPIGAWMDKVDKFERSCAGSGSPAAVAVPLHEPRAPCHGPEPGPAAVH